jgi:TPR repeat protein
VGRDTKEAVRLFKLAAELGYAPAQRLLSSSAGQGLAKTL